MTRMHRIRICRGESSGRRFYLPGLSIQAKDPFFFKNTMDFLNARETLFVNCVCLFIVSLSHVLLYLYCLYEIFVCMFKYFPDILKSLSLAISLSSPIRCPYIEMRTCIFVFLYHFHSSTQKEITYVTYVLSVKFSTYSFTYDVLVICTYLYNHVYAICKCPVFFPKPLSTGNSPNESKLRKLPPWQSYKSRPWHHPPGFFDGQNDPKKHKILTKFLIKTAKSCRISKISKISMWISMWIHVSSELCQS